MHLSLMGSDELQPLKETASLHSKSIQSSSGFETSHELCKDAMLEKIVLISVSYFCIATEMRFLMNKATKNAEQPTLASTKKDSEMYHAKAVHISSLFLPKDCPLV